MSRITRVSPRFLPAALAAAAIGLAALFGAPAAQASEKSDCEGKGGTYTETTITDNTNGKIGTVHRCCVTDAQTNTTSCTSTTVTKASRIPPHIVAGEIESSENVQPVVPTYRVPLDVLSTDAQIHQAP